MSTYAIADAINKFADNFKYAIGEKNQIEKEKLAFEKEKFEYYKAFEEQQLESCCKHDWHINGRLFGKEARYTMHTCSNCGKEEILKTYKDDDDRWVTHSV